MGAVIPALRASLVRRLAERGMGEKQIAKSLGITQASVSKYLHGRQARGALSLKKAKEAEAAEALLARMILRKAPRRSIAAAFDRAAARYLEAHQRA